MLCSKIASFDATYNLLVPLNAYFCFSSSHMPYPSMGPNLFDKIFGIRPDKQQLFTVDFFHLLDWDEVITTDCVSIDAKHGLMTLIGSGT